MPSSSPTRSAASSPPLSSEAPTTGRHHLSQPWCSVNCGTTVKGGIDNLKRIVEVLDEVIVHREQVERHVPVFTFGSPWLQVPHPR